jgi:Glycosyl hydrolases family 32 N-terminal domain
LLQSRSEELDSDKTLPPLSTGRIGRATSKNGLHWVKDTKGSVSEDMTGVCIGLNRESWWGFDTAHCGLGSVLLPMSTPAVLMEGGVYLNYYFGGSYDETPISDFLEQTPEAMKDAKIKGMKMKIGVAVSQDGVSWGRVEGDDPSGACIVPFDRKDPNSQEGKKAMDEELYCAWPEVVVSTDNKKRAFSMYYSTMLKENKQKCIAFAQSADGFRWEKEGVCLTPDEEGLDAGGCARCTLSRDAVWDGSAWKQLDSWTMYYEGVSKEDNKHRIMMATSKDGKKWEKAGLVFDVGSSDDWDSEGVGAPHVIR